MRTILAVKYFGVLVDFKLSSSVQIVVAKRMKPLSRFMANVGGPKCSRGKFLMFNQYCYRSGSVGRFSKTEIPFELGKWNWQWRRNWCSVDEKDLSSRLFWLSLESHRSTTSPKEEKTFTSGSRKEMRKYAFRLKHKWWRAGREVGNRKSKVTEWESSSKG